jgi:hypothetical protein
MTHSEVPRFGAAVGELLAICIRHRTAVRNDALESRLVRGSGHAEELLGWVFNLTAKEVADEKCRSLSRVFAPTAISRCSALCFARWPR